VALIKRMKAVTQAANIPLVIVEISSIDPNGWRGQTSLSRRFLRLRRTHGSPKRSIAF
jgi:hypothetical protein